MSSWAPFVERLVECHGGTDQGEMGEGLWCVAELPSGRSDLLAEQADRVGEAEQLVEVALRLLDQMLHFMALLLWVAGGLAFVDPQGIHCRDAAATTLNVDARLPVTPFPQFHKV